MENVKDNSMKTSQYNEQTCPKEGSFNLNFSVVQKIHSVTSVKSRDESLSNKDDLFFNRRKSYNGVDTSVDVDNLLYILWLPA